MPPINFLLNVFLSIWHGISFLNSIVDGREEQKKRDVREKPGLEKIKLTFDSYLHDLNGRTVRNQTRRPSDIDQLIKRQTVVDALIDVELMQY